MEHMRIETDSSGIAVLTLDRAGSSANVIDDEWLADLDQVLDWIAAHDGLTGVIIVSAKPDFLGGANISALAQEFGTMTAFRGFQISQRVSGFLRRMERLGIPVVAAIHGAALDGGLELAMACHHRIVADDAASLLGLPQVNLGLQPGAGGTQRLPRLIGVQHALDLLLTGRTISAAQALEMGVVDAVVQGGSLMAAAREWLSGPSKIEKPWDMKGYRPPESRGLLLPEVAAAYSLAAAGVAGMAGYDHPAPIGILSCVFEGMQLPFDRALQIESKYFGRLIADSMARDVMRVASQACHAKQ